MYKITKKRIEEALRLRRNLMGKMTMASYQETLNRVNSMSAREREQLIKKHNARIEPTLRKQLLEGKVFIEGLND